MKKYRVNQLLDLYSSRFFLSRDLRKSLSKKNLENLITVLYVLLLYGIAGFLYEFFIHIDNPSAGYFRLWYFGTYIVLSVICIPYSLLIKKRKIENLAVVASPYGISLCVMYALVIYCITIMDNIFTGLVLFAGTGIVTVLFLSIEPLFIVVLVIITNFCSDFVILQVYGYDGLLDFVVLSGLIIVLSFYKCKRTKHDLLRTQMLEDNRDALQDAVSIQVEEIREQNEQLKGQHQKIIDIQNNTIISLSNLVENRDSDTGEHVRRTSAYVNLIACKALHNGFYDDIITDEYISLLTKAAPMHDIGKIVVPDSILKKPGKLSDDEFNQIKRHTTEGGRIVKEVLGEGEDQDYVKMAMDVATSHHERWDGKGYPYGLKNINIPLSARIMAIADVFDALVSPRCYKEPFSVKKAMSIIQNEAGSHFDPVLANLFITMEDDAVAVMEKYKD